MINLIKKLREELLILNAQDIIIRYWILNSFDSILVMIGILVGAYLSKEITRELVISVGIASALAMFVSGFFGAYTTEEAESYKEINEIERAMLKKLEGKLFKGAKKEVPLITALSNGLSPLLNSLIILIPFFMKSFFSVKNAFYVSLAIAIMLLFMIGCYLGRISRKNILINGLKVILVAILAVALIYLINLI
ncbi:MAG: VIT1/CCC1 transporter family protein [Candidatus Woesearchaeota archaeon]